MYNMFHNYTQIKLLLGVFMAFLLQWFLLFSFSGEDATEQLIKAYFENVISQTPAPANQEQNCIINISLL